MYLFIIALPQIVDDPLSAHGKEQAAARAEDACFTRVSRVYVSPLQRTMETCMLVFGGRADVQIIVTPALREFNYMQTAEAPLGPRHVGHDIDWLRQRFPQPNIVWEDAALQGTWWEPHGDLQACNQRVQTFMRTLVPESASPPPASAALPTFRPPPPVRQESTFNASQREEARLSRDERQVDDAEEELLQGDGAENETDHHPGTQALPEIAIVTHENVLRIMLGIGTVAHCEAIFATLTYTQLPAPKDQRFVIAVPHLPSWQQQLTKREFLVLLGCSDPNIQARRSYGAIDTAVAQQLPVIVACAVSEYASFRQSLKEYCATRKQLSTREQNAFVCDINSRVTECNATYSMALIEAHTRCLGILKDPEVAQRPLVMRIVTSDWHMPRALLAFRNMAAVFDFKATIVPLSVATSILDIRGYSFRHLGEGAILSTRIGRYPELWPEIRQECRDDLYVLSFLMRQWASPRMHNGTQDKRDALRDLLLKGGDAQRQDISNLLLRAFQADQPLALQPLKSNGSSSAIHYAAETGCLNVVSDLLMFWGADAHAINSKGMTPIELARKEGHFDVVDLLLSTIDV